MIISYTSHQVEDVLHDVRNQGLKIGFVPTMGALHSGHQSLIDRARSDSDFVVVSIFVNPAQFNNPEDLKNYPRTVDADISLLSQSGCDMLFLPDEKEIYPDGIVHTGVHLPLGNLGSVMEAAYRPGHFEGVVSVVYRLFTIVKPNLAFFGEKDYQQLLIVKELAKNYFPNIRIVPVETYRYGSGLAMSSRNMRLTDAEREQAAEIYRGMNEVQKFVSSNSTAWTSYECREIFENHLKKYAPLLKIEYFLVVDQRTLSEANAQTPKAELRAFAAVYANNIRLIDNMKLF